MKAILKIVVHIILFSLLTVITQIGGVVYLLSLLIGRKFGQRKTLSTFVVFITLYLLSTLLLVPILALVFGRERIKDSDVLQAQSYFYKLANRNYVSTNLNESLQQISEDFERQNNGIMVVYLDANFPFIDGFPLFPHLSHNDGNKVDLTFIYTDFNGEMCNKKPSRSGYGVYEDAQGDELNQTQVCKEQGFWQYDFPKYLSLGHINKDVSFSAKGTKSLALSILQEKRVEKLFIEPHLKTRLGLNDEKVRFHGCYAVRHDDHIHFQVY